MGIDIEVIHENGKKANDIFSDMHILRVQLSLCVKTIFRLEHDGIAMM